MDPNAVLVGNLTSALEQANRYLALGLVTALSVVLIDRTRTGRRKYVPLPGVPVLMSPQTAKMVLLGFYFVAGIMAFVATMGAIKSANLLITSDASTAANGAEATVSLLQAACTYPSIATAQYPIRLGAGLLPPIFAGFVVWGIYQRMEAWTPGEKGAAIVMTALAVSPYLGVTWAMVKVLPCPGGT